MVKYWQRYSVTNTFHVCMFEYTSSKEKHRTLTLSSSREFSDLNLSISSRNSTISRRSRKSKKKIRANKPKERQREPSRDSGTCLKADDGKEDSPLMIEFFKEIQIRELKNYYAKKIAVKQFNTESMCPICGWSKGPPVCVDISQHD